MKCFLIGALSATALSALATATPAAAQGTAPGSPRGTAPVTIEGYGPSSAIVCDQAGTTCWHSVDQYDYPSGANVVVHPYDWQGDSGANYAWREHPRPRVLAGRAVAAVLTSQVRMMSTCE
jgi:hypothetical protein